MSRYRHALPQSSDRLFLTDGGLETTLIFHEGLELPEFAAIELHRRPGGEDTLRAYFARYTEIARRHGAGFVFESASWRASGDWGTRLGFSREELERANRRSIDFLAELREAFESAGDAPGVISACIGPRGDGYVASHRMSVAEAEQYHGFQVGIFETTEADLVSAVTMNYVEEAIGIALAARAAHMPVVISFTVETDGKLPTGQSLQQAIEQVDAATDRHPAYYMINCAHPTHFDPALAAPAPWLARIRGLRANASRLSHAELNESTTLDSGDPAELGRQYAELWGRLPRLVVLGGCCGTDHRHIEAIAGSCAPLFAERR